MNLTLVEQAAMAAIFAKLGMSDGQTDVLLKQLRVNRREWTSDVADTERGIGLFVYFSAHVVLPINVDITHQGVWAAHDEAPGGVDFLLFPRDGVIDCLEIGFFGFPVRKTILDDPAGSFRFQA